jgi:hypothetical protein
MTFACPCGTEFTDTIHQTVNVTLEPQLLYRLLAGSLNVPTCPNCGRKAAAPQPFFFHDMKRGLFAYVHPHEQVSDEEREELLNRLRRAYTLAVEESERQSQAQPRPANLPRPKVRRRQPHEDLRAALEPDAPPMQVIFGVENLITLVDSLLEPEEKLGKVALSARTTKVAERQRLRDIASNMANQMGCFVEIEDEPDNYTVWMYGPRARISSIAHALDNSR